MAENGTHPPSDANAAKERDAQKQFWAEHSAKPTVEAMMLDSKAAEIDQMERPEASHYAHMEVKPSVMLCVCIFVVA